MNARTVALGGLLAAAAVLLMLLGGLIPAATYVAPMLASMLLIPLLTKLPRVGCVGWYAVVSLLSALLCPDKETAFVFVFLGWYPIARRPLSRLPRLPRIAVKLLIFNLAAAALYALLIFVLQLDAVAAEAKELTLALGVALALLGNVTFLLFDLLLGRAERYWRKKTGER